MRGEGKTRSEGAAAVGLAAWHLLAREPGLRAGGFEARARGPLAGEFVLSSSGDGGTFGRLRMRGVVGADFVSDALPETILQRQGLYGARYRVTTGGAQVLIAGPERPEEPLRLLCGGRAYGVETSLLRGRAVARPLGTDGGPEGGSDEGAVSLRGGVAGRRYRAEFAGGDGVSLAVAVFVLYRTVALRRQAY
jgi:hypothetical protein